MTKYTTVSSRLMHSEGMQIPFAEFEFDETERFEKLKKILSEPRFQPKETGQTYRVLNNWAEKGLLRSSRAGEETGWRKFSVSDMVWVRLIHTLRSFGMSIRQIERSYQSTFFAPNGTPWNLFDFWIARCMQGDLVKVVVFDDGHMEYLHHLEFEMNEMLGTTTHLSFINVSLNDCYNFVRGKDKSTLPSVPFKVHLSHEELELVEQIRSGDLDEVQVKLKDGSITDLKLSVSSSINPQDFISKIQHGEILVKVEDGKPVFTKATLKRKMEQ